MEIDKSFERVFHGRNFEISVSVAMTGLTVLAKEAMTGNGWRGTFNSQFIEEMTAKTGNFKKFQVFCKMLMSGLDKTSQSVIVDFISKEELDKLRNEPRASKDNKMLMILTYVVEFDKVQYPLTLQFCSNLSLKKIQTLEVDELKSQLIELRTIKQEKDIMEKRLEGLITERDREIYYLNKEKEELQSELDKIKKQMDIIIEQLENQADLSMSKHEKKEEEFRRQKEKMEAEIERYRRDTKVLRDEGKKDKNRILQLESELKTMFSKSRHGRPKSISGSSSNLQRSSIVYKENDELNHKLSTLKMLLERAKE